MERQEAIGVAPALQDRALAEAALTAQVGLVISPGFSLRGFLDHRRQRGLPDPLINQGPNKAPRDKGGIGHASPDPTRFCDKSQHLCLVEILKGNTLGLHHLGEDTDAANVLPDRVLRVLLVDKMLAEAGQMFSEKLKSGFSNCLDVNGCVCVYSSTLCRMSTLERC
jgi:hypothetical protein